jgi:midasin
MVNFTSVIHCDTAEKGVFGHMGSPWEFNLRDIFRWAELLVSNDQPSPQQCRSIDRFARDLYLQRFRTKADRGEVESRYSPYSDSQIDALPMGEITVSESTLHIGDVTIPRRNADEASPYSVYQLEASLLFPLKEPLETVARCIAMN